MAPLICWSFSSSMFRYLLVDHAVPAMCRSLAAARLSADRLPVGERAHDARAPSDLAQDALERIVGADAPPVLLREGVVGECLLDRYLDELGGPSQPQRPQLVDHSDGFLACRRDVLARVDRLEHRRNLPHLGRGHVAEDVAVPVHDAALPSGLGEKLGGTFGKSQAGVRDDQPDPAQTALLEMLEEPAPARLVLLGPLADAENLPITLAV